MLLLTEPWTGAIDWVGGALRGHRGDGLGGIHPADAGGRRPLQWDRWARDHDSDAALATTFIGLPQAWGTSRPGSWFQAIGLALLLPVIPFTLELQALRRLTTAAFGTLMALEPAVATMWGVVLLLAQIPQAAQFLGVVLVVIAGIGAERSGRARRSGNIWPENGFRHSNTGSQLRILWWRTAVTPATGDQREQPSNRSASGPGPVRGTGGRRARGLDGPPGGLDRAEAQRRAELGTQPAAGTGASPCSSASSNHFDDVLIYILLAAAVLKAILGSGLTSGSSSGRGHQRHDRLHPGGRAEDAPRASRRCCR